MTRSRAGLRERLIVESWLCGWCGFEERIAGAVQKPGQLRGSQQVPQVAGDSRDGWSLLLLHAHRRTTGAGLGDHSFSCLHVKA